MQQTMIFLFIVLLLFSGIAREMHEWKIVNVFVWCACAMCCLQTFQIQFVFPLQRCDD